MTKYFAQCRAEEGTREENISTQLFSIKITILAAWMLVTIWKKLVGFGRHSDDWPVHASFSLCIFWSIQVETVV